jgi:DNA-binding transcriptional regulator YhcF (GntR family)
MDTATADRRRQADGLPGIAVDRDGDLPVGTQLAWQIRAMITGGRIGEGQRLPSVRELAAQADVNVNTARAAYRRLEEDGLIVAHQGLGTFAAAPTRTPENVERIAAGALAEAREAGLDPRDLATAIYASADLTPVSDLPSRITSTPLPDVERDSDEVGVRRDLRRQIARLEAELGNYVQHLPRQENPTHPLLRPKGHVAGVAELEETRDRLLERLASVRTEGARRADREQRARTHLERMVRDPERHKWQWVSNEDVGEPGCKTWHTRPRFGLVGMFMGWWRVKVSSGCPLSGTA